MVLKPLMNLNKKYFYKENAKPTWFYKLIIHARGNTNLRKG